MSDFFFIGMFENKQTVKKTIIQVHIFSFTLDFQYFATYRILNINNCNDKKQT